MNRRHIVIRRASLGLCVIVLAGCASTRIAINEKFGYTKREQLVDRVQDARDDQEKAKTQFNSALEEFLAVTRAEPSELETIYTRLNREYERSEDKAQDVHGRIRAVEQVALALFQEWEKELNSYTSDSLRLASQRQLDTTRDRYERLLAKMKQAAASMTPVLAAFKDQVLFLKHNLNAQAVASLQENLGELESDVIRLIAEMEASISEANEFIEGMQSEDG